LVQFLKTKTEPTFSFCTPVVGSTLHCLQLVCYRVVTNCLWTGKPSWSITNTKVNSA